MVPTGFRQADSGARIPFVAALINSSFRADVRHPSAASKEHPRPRGCALFLFSHFSLRL